MIIIDHKKYLEIFHVFHLLILFEYFEKVMIIHKEMKEEHQKNLNFNKVGKTAFIL